MQVYALPAPAVAGEARQSIAQRTENGLKQDQTTVPHERLRPLTWPIWLAWVLVAALDPVLSTISATALEKPVTRTAEHPVLITIGLWAIIALAFVAPPIMQGLVLKRVLPKLSVWLWFFGVTLSGIVWLALAASRHAYWLIDAGFRTQSALQGDGFALRQSDALNTMMMFVLSWGLFLLWTIAIGTLTSLVPALMLGVASGRRRATLLFLASAIAGACVSGIVEQIHHLSGNGLPTLRWALNGMSWTQRFQILTDRGGIGAVWGATTAFVVALMTHRLRARP